jgi:hypothetical protein
MDEESKYAPLRVVAPILPCSGNDIKQSRQ